MKNIAVFASILLTLSCNQSPTKNTRTNRNLSPSDSLAALVKAYPDSMPLRYGLIDLYVANDEFKKAIEVSEGIIEKNSADPVSWQTKASIQFFAADTAGAIKTFEYSMTKAPDLENRISLGILYAQTRNNNAISLADSLLARNRKDAEKTAFYIKGLYYSFSNQKEIAIAYFDTCLNIDFTYMDAYREKGIALYDLNRFAASADVLKRAVTLQNNFDEGYYYLGKAYEKLGKKDEAIEAYQTALRYDKEYTEAKEALNRLGKMNDHAP